MIRAIIERLMLLRKNHLGNQGYFMPKSNCAEKIINGMANIVVKNGIYGIGMHSGNEKIIIKIPKPLSFRDTFSSSIDMQSDLLLRTTWRKNSEVDKLDLSLRLLIFYCILILKLQLAEVFSKSYSSLSASCVESI